MTSYLLWVYGVARYFRGHFVWLTENTCNYFMAFNAVCIFVILLLCVLFDWELRLPTYVLVNLEGDLANLGGNLANMFAFAALYIA